jgi:hypothetical protein
MRAYPHAALPGGGQFPPHDRGRLPPEGVLEDEGRLHPQDGVVGFKGHVTVLGDDRFHELGRTAAGVEPASPRRDRALPRSDRATRSVAPGG